MLRFLVAFFCFFCLHHAIAQQDFFEKGYIISLSGDTIRGTVQRLRDNRMSEMVLFNATTASPGVKTYKPFEIKGFGTTKDGIYFESVEYVNRSPDKTQTYQRFAKQLIAGYASLFRLDMTDAELAAIPTKMQDLDHVYILKKNGEWFTLDQYILHNKEQNIDLMQTRYIGMLKLAMQDCPRMQAGMEEVKFNDNNMSAVVINYNKCIHPELKVRALTGKTKTTWRFGANINGTALMPNKYNEVNMGGAFGIFVQRYNQGNNENAKLSFGLEYLYMDYIYNDSKIKYDMKLLRIPIMFNYYLSQKPMKPFVHIGITASSKVLLLNAGTGLETDRLSAQVMLETFPFRPYSPKLLSLRLGIFL